MQFIFNGNDIVDFLLRGSYLSSHRNHNSRTTKTTAMRHTNMINSIIQSMDYRFLRRILHLTIFMNNPVKAALLCLYFIIKLRLKPRELYLWVQHQNSRYIVRI